MLRKDDQQVHTSEIVRDPTIDFAWMISLFEQKMTFILFRDFRNNLTPRICFEHKDSEVVEKVLLHLEALDCSSHVRSFENKYSYTRITIQGLKRCQKFLTVTSNLWQKTNYVKMKDALLKYFENRLSRPMNVIDVNEDNVIANQLKQLNS